MKRMIGVGLVMAGTLGVLMAQDAQITVRQAAVAAELDPGAPFSTTMIDRTPSARSDTTQSRRRGPTL